MRFRSAGFTLLELLTVIAIIGIVTSALFYNYRKGLSPARDMTNALQGKLAFIRSDAMANTLAERLIVNDKTFTVQTALSCNSTSWTDKEALAFDSGINISQVSITVPEPTGTVDASLPSGSKMVACFSPRGLAIAPSGLNNGSVALTDTKKTYTIQIALGGGVNVTTN